MPTLLLIRHGQNDFVKKHRMAGWLPGVHLNEAGRAQADALAQSLGRVKLAAVYSSPLERAAETAEPIAQAQRLTVIQRPALGELKVGKWEGRSLRSLRTLKAWRVVQSTPSLARFPGGESFNEAQARVATELTALLAAHPSKTAVIACVSHADMIKLAVAHFVGLPLDLFQRLVVDPASVSTLWVHGGLVRLLRLNDTSAVRDLQAR
jgi:probable phosphomutase (TIGR03848 family)